MNTGIFLDEKTFDEVYKAMQPVIEVDLKTGLNIQSYPNVGQAKRILNEYAVSNGLEKPGEGQSYGVNGEKEIVNWN